MANIRPFRGLRPPADLAGAIIAPPYDVLSTDEAREIVSRKPQSFLRITRPDVDLSEGEDIHGPAAYGQARRSLEAFIAQGLLVTDAEPCFYLYGQRWRGREQQALLALCSCDEYDAGTIKKHELTRPDKENDRADHIDALGAQTGLVFLAHRADAAVAQARASALARPPLWEVTTDDDVCHTFRVISDPQEVAALQAAFAEVPALYIADGHHRSAAASRVARRRDGEGTSAWFLAGIFPDTELRVLAYNRVVRDLSGHTPESFRAALGECFEITADVEPVPTGRGRWTVYLEGRWWELRARPGVVPEDDPVGRLDAAVLQDRVLGPLLGIANPRTDTRIKFVGGIRGHTALSGSVDAGNAAVAFHLHPTAMSELFAVADADRLMPPKCTWFEPKLRGGVVVHVLD